MIPARWQQVADLLHDAMQLAPSQRAKWLENLGATDPDLRQEVESLLYAHDEAESSFLSSSTPSIPIPVTPNAATERAGERFGDYRIMGQIGEGGMGEVYRAVRDDDQYQKEVAIKVVRGGQDSSFVVSRFRNERQILASLDHPNIARLLDGGTTETGVPYFVMELIEGKPIDEYCKEHGISIERKLELFLRVCSAVQFAHQRLIIHRDIKPGNILVTPDGVPKLLDFGIAKILEGGAVPGRVEPTLTMFRLLTPAYASPEQVRGEPITTASDVYSLGVVLYELLAGQHPYKSSYSTPEDLARAVCEKEPEKPSTALRRTEAEVTGRKDGEAITPGHGNRLKLSKRLRGDLDNIILMALRKEPQRRYASVERFAEDIRRHQDSLPVIARKDTVRYRVEKFVARHRAAVVAAAAVCIVMIVALAVTLREAQIARRRYNDVRSMANSLIFDVHDAIKDLPGSTPARKVIVDRALQYLNALARESSGDAGLQRELATAYERVGMVQGHYRQDNLGDIKGSLDSYQKALAIRKEVGAKSKDWTDQLALARAYRLVSEQQQPTGDGLDARTNIDQAIAISEGLNRGHPNDPQVLYELGVDYHISGATFYAQPPGEKLEDRRKELAVDEALMKLQPDDLATLEAYAKGLNSMGTSLEGSDAHAALPYYEKELGVDQIIRRKSNAVRYGRGLAVSYRDVGSVYEELGDFQRALENYSEGLKIMQEVNRADPQNATLRQSLAIAYTNTAQALAKVGRISLAVEDSEKSAEIMRSLVSTTPENAKQRDYLATILAMGGIVLIHAHQPDSAMKKLEEARALFEPTDKAYAGSGNVYGAACREKMGEAMAMGGNAESASNYFHQALTIVEPVVSSVPSNLDAFYVAAESYSGLADLSYQRAQQPGRTSSDRKADLDDARKWYGKSIGVWHAIQHPSRTSPKGFEASDPTIVARKMQRCEAALRSVRSTSTALPHSVRH
jgi:serine/threonine protein kinase